jgi:hypothetical protein
MGNIRDILVIGRRVLTVPSNLVQINKFTALHQAKILARHNLKRQTVALPNEIVEAERAMATQ